MDWIKRFSKCGLQNPGSFSDLLGNLLEGKIIFTIIQRYLPFSRFDTHSDGTKQKGGYVTVALAHATAVPLSCISSHYTRKHPDMLSNTHKKPINLRKLLLMLILLNLDSEYKVLKKNSLYDIMETTHKAPLLHTLNRCLKEKQVCNFLNCELN